MTKYIWILLVAIVLIVGCEGPAGPKGNTGDRGPIGLTGPSPLNFSGSATVNSLGEAYVDLPIGFGTYSQPPVITCYLGDGSGVWLIVGTDVSIGGVTAGILWVSNHWRVGLIGGAVPGWTFLVEAVW